MPTAAQRVAGLLAEAFEQDRGLAEQQNACQHRPGAANRQRWSGLHPNSRCSTTTHTLVGIAADGRIRSHVNAVMIDRLHGGADEQQLETAILAVVQEIHSKGRRIVSRICPELSSNEPISGHLEGSYLQ
ncbi:MAG: hypothetical protein ACR2L9_08280 [Solirubrobacteraceae bacterium]